MLDSKISQIIYLHGGEKVLQRRASQRAEQEVQSQAKKELNVDSNSKIGSGFPVTPRPGATTKPTQICAYPGFSCYH